MGSIVNERACPCSCGSMADRSRGVSGGVVGDTWRWDAGGGADTGSGRSGRGDKSVAGGGPLLSFGSTVGMTSGATWRTPSSGRSSGSCGRDCSGVAGREDDGGEVCALLGGSDGDVSYTGRRFGLGVAGAADSAGSDSVSSAVSVGSTGSHKPTPPSDGSKRLGRRGRTGSEPAMLRAIRCCRKPFMRRSAPDRIGVARD
jgi:hypothetical protein